MYFKLAELSKITVSNSIRYPELKKNNEVSKKECGAYGKTKLIYFDDIVREVSFYYILS